MPIKVTLKEVMDERGVRVGELAEKVGITNVNISRIRTGRVKAIRFSTLEKLCENLECEPSDLIKYEKK